MYTLKEILIKEIWDDFIINANFEFYSFLQSWEWGLFQELSGKKIIRYGIYEKGTKLVGVMLIIKVYAKRGNYYFVPHGPLIKGDFFEVLSSILGDLKVFAVLEGMNFIRFNSAVKNTIENKKAFEKLNFINAPMHEHAEDTHLLDLTIPEEQLLNNIKKKDRYLINRAIKELVEIRIDNKIDHVEKLIKMHTQHANRKDGKKTYTAFSSDFIKDLYKVFGDDISTISASYNGKIESILMTIKFGKVCVYYIAASDIISHKFSPNYLCQWEAIKKAKNDGCEIYNFWGVSPDNNPKHPIAGVSQFKRKFAGYDYSLLHAQDLVLSPFYYINWIVETFRRIKRGYYYKKPE
ncbi:MAG: peptidoglycan bridge formation glycyltransferase FemA/FemB family protein [Candidatus Gracilibacteria bacterium]|nr:peptidoglycan bridge formation glycyltransferase FemA/FemB family protein [Candidatus Gracilibacteria bacterium]